MKHYTDEEIKAMVGTEFIYVHSGRAEMGAVVAAYKPDKAFTCLATELVDSVGDTYDKYLDSNGNLCLLGLSTNREDLAGRITIALRCIKCLGYYRTGVLERLSLAKRGGFGNPICSIA